MMTPVEKYNPHERAPNAVRELYNECRHFDPSQLCEHPRILDLQGLDLNRLPDGLFLEGRIPQSVLDLAFDDFIGNSSWRTGLEGSVEGANVYGIKQVPGLQILPSLLPPPVQVELLSRLLHRDLSDEKHQTNLHLHYDISYPSPMTSGHETVSTKADLLQGSVAGNSFFQEDPTRVFQPKEPTVHRPLSIRASLNRKLRWMTLGGQYNWTSKEYPQGPPPPFPQDIGILLRRIFPATTAEAAIVNIYSPGDTLNPHRDVSEECDTGLISISFGCDGLFLVGHNDEDGCAVIRLRSGDAVYMTGQSRFAWHAVPKIVASTCPSWIENWPAGRCDDISDSRFESWRGWMAGKRVNLNVRQMFPHPTSKQAS